MTVTDALRGDHELVRQVLDGLGAVAVRLAQGGAVPRTLLDGAADFFTTFLDRCHHAKEEEALIPALYEHGLRLDQMPALAVRDDHLRARELMNQLRRELERTRGASPNGTIATLLGEYVALMRRHIEDEECVLFARADASLSAAEDARVQTLCDAVEARELRPEARAAARELAEALIAACRSETHRRPPGKPEVAADVMRTDVPRLSPDQSLATAAELMRSHGVRELAVVEGGRLVGILVRHDLDAHRGHFEWTPVRTAMTREPVTVSPETSADVVARLLLARGFNAVPVVAGEGCVGMLARSDLLHLLLG